MRRKGKKLLCCLLIAAVLLLLAGCGRTEMRDGFGRIAIVISRLAAQYAEQGNETAAPDPAITAEPTAAPAPAVTAAPTAMPMPALEEDELPWVPA